MSIHLTDVTLRDGLQMESQIFSTDQKLALYDLLRGCGYSRIEITSFVHPKWVPQFKDAKEFCTRLFATNPDVEVMAFVPNQKGLERLLEFPIPWVSTFVAVSETFNKKNINETIDNTLKNLKAVVSQAHESHRKIRVYASAVFGCPYEGPISDSDLNKRLDQIIALNPDEIVLSDTIGVAVPKQVESVVSQFIKKFAVEKTAIHFHDTYGLALSGIVAAWNLGIRHFDGSTGGVGGCPFAKGAPGNAATENLAYAFFRMGARPSFAVEAIGKTLKFLHEDMKQSLHSPLYEIMQRGGTLYGLQ